MDGWNLQLMGTLNMCPPYYSHNKVRLFETYRNVCVGCRIARTRVDWNFNS